MHFMEEFKKKHKINLKDNKKAMMKLRKESERAKRSLSSSNNNLLKLNILCDGIDFNSTISRARFEQLNAGLFQQCLQSVEQVLLD